MLIDTLSEFAAGSATVDQAELLGAAGTEVLGAGIPIAGDHNGTTIYRHIGDGRPVFVVFWVRKTVVGGTTLTFQLCTDSAADLSASPAILAQSGPIPVSSLAAGALVCIPLPAGATYEEYINVRVVRVGPDVTAGSVAAFISFDPPATGRLYPDSGNLGVFPTASETTA